MKNIILRDEVYEKLARLKRKHESFSELILRILKEKEQRIQSIKEGFGLFSGKEGKELHKAIKEVRRRSKVRAVDI